MSEISKVKVRVEWGDMIHTVEGDLETVVREIMQFAARVLPNYMLASKLTFSPDYSAMVEDLSESVKLAPDGEAVLLKSGLSAENSITLVLLATKVGNAVGTRPTASMSSEFLSKATMKSVKTIRNTLAQLSKTGLVERDTEGDYKLTIQGILRAQEIGRNMTPRSTMSSQPPSEMTAK